MLGLLIEEKTSESAVLGVEGVVVRDSVGESVARSPVERQEIPVGVP